MIPEPLLKAIQTKRCLLFLGAGFSKNALLPDGLTMPNWKELAEKLSDITKMHTKGERYIWSSDTGTNKKFWDDRELMEYSHADWMLSIYDYKKERGHGLTIPQLQKRINLEEKHTYQNEML